MKRKGHYYRLVMSRTGLSVDGKGQGRCTPERLRQVWLFATAPLESLQTLAKRFTTRTCFTDDVVYEKGADADAMYFLVSGQVRPSVHTLLVPPTFLPFDKFLLSDSAHPLPTCLN